MKTELANEMAFAAGKVQYDEHVKRVLANRYILAWILHETADEFRELSIPKIAKDCIQEGIEISECPVVPGQTNAPERIIGDNTEDKVPGEGTVFYDIRFHARSMGNQSLPMKLLVNIEGQRDYYPGYPLVTRGVFYGTRMISSQLGTEFRIPDYGSLRKVYSIWICMNTPASVGNAISRYCLTKEDLIGFMPAKQEDYDKLCLVFIGIGKNPSSGGILRLLGVLLSRDMKAGEKQQILAEEFDIPVEQGALREELNHMCNLSDYVEQCGIEKGILMGRKEGRQEGRQEGRREKVLEQIGKKLARGKTVEEIADALEEKPDTIRELIASLSAM